MLNTVNLFIGFNLLRGENAEKVQILESNKCQKGAKTKH